MKTLKILPFVLTVLLFASNAYALPQFTLLTGNRCVNCHVNIQGSGLRSDLGFYYSEALSIFKPEKAGLGGLYAGLTTNTAFEGMLTFGMDFRFQTARGNKEEDTRKYFPMQLSPSVAFAPFKWLTLEGTLNLFTPIPRNKYYPGQQWGQASILIQPDFHLPQLRVGFFQPSIGMRYDDHTMLIRRFADATAYKSIIAPYFGDLGAELHYDVLDIDKKFRISALAGVFRAQALSEVKVSKLAEAPIPIVDSSAPLILGRITLWDHGTFIPTVNSYLGASLLVQNDFSLLNVYAGVGITDALSVMFEYAKSNKTGLQSSANLMATVSYQVMPGLLLELRGERGTTTLTGLAGEVNSVTMASIGAQIFPLPFIEVRPEYRYFMSDQDPLTVNGYEATRWAVHLHIFY